MLLSTLLCLAWLAALCLDVGQGVASLWSLLVAGGLSIWWGAHVWRLWRAWVAGATPIELAWTGPLQDAPAQLGPVLGPLSAPLPGGWRLLGAGADAPSVQVSMVFDWQGWLLLRVRPLILQRTVPREVWFWVDLRRCPDAHHLRALLCLPAHLTTPARGAPGSASHPVASWLPRDQSGAALQASSRQPQRRGSSLASASDFPVSEFKTTQLQAWDEPPAESGRGRP